MLIVLPYPDAVLLPNARLHWAKLVDAKKTARAAAHWETLHQLGFKAVRRLAALDKTVKLPMAVRFYPPDSRGRDDDNAIAAFKASRDGIASAIGIDDSRFVPSYEFGIVHAPGRVEIEIDEAVLQQPLAGAA